MPAASACGALGLTNKQLIMTGSVDTRTALRGALDFDVVVVWTSSGRQAKSEMRKPESQLDVKNNISRSSLVLDCVKNIKLDFGHTTSKLPKNNYWDCLPTFPTGVEGKSAERLS